VSEVHPAIDPVAGDVSRIGAAQNAPGVIRGTTRSGGNVPGMGRIDTIRDRNPCFVPERPGVQTDGRYPEFAVPVQNGNVLFTDTPYDGEPAP
jgi:hypothetical protein